MKIIAYDNFKPGVTLDDLKPYLRDEVSNVWRLWKAGIVRENYARADVGGVIIVFELDSVEEAEALHRRFSAVESRVAGMGFPRLRLRTPAARISVRPQRRHRQTVGPDRGMIRSSEGIEIPTSLAEWCDPNRMALVVEPQQVVLG